MRDAGARVGLVAGAGADPVADRGRPHVRQALRDHPLARVELGLDPGLHGVIVRGRAEPTREGNCPATRTPERRNQASLLKKGVAWIPRFTGRIKWGPSSNESWSWSSSACSCSCSRSGWRRTRRARERWRRSRSARC